jgi:hypothetical protein
MPVLFNDRARRIGVGFVGADVLRVCALVMSWACGAFECVGSLWLA